SQSLPDVQGLSRAPTCLVEPAQFCQDLAPTLVMVGKVELVLRDLLGPGNGSLLLLNRLLVSCQRFLVAPLGSQGQADVIQGPPQGTARGAVVRVRLQEPVVDLPGPVV